VEEEGSCCAGPINVSRGARKRMGFKSDMNDRSMVNEVLVSLLLWLRMLASTCLPHERHTRSANQYDVSFVYVLSPSFDRFWNISSQRLSLVSKFVPVLSGLSLYCLTY
jgi:hypothetical protein